MGSATDDRPKCFAKIDGRRLIDWQIAALRDAALDDITIVGGYRREMLAPYADQVLANCHWAETNMVTSLVCAADILRSHDCIVSYSDILYHPDIVRALSASNADIAISFDEDWRSLWSDRFTDPRNDAEGFEAKDGYLVSIGDRPEDLDDVRGQYMGLLRISPRGWQEIEGYLSTLDGARRDCLDMTGLLAALLDKGVGIETIAITGKWCEVDSADDLTLYRHRISEAAAWSHDWRWK